MADFISSKLIIQSINHDIHVSVHIHTNLHPLRLDSSGFVRPEQCSRALHGYQLHYSDKINLWSATGPTRTTNLQGYNFTLNWR